MVGYTRYRDKMSLSARQHAMLQPSQYAVVSHTVWGALLPSCDIRFSDIYGCGLAGVDLPDVATCFDEAGRNSIETM